jgi:hypothetical protein
MSAADLADRDIINVNDNPAEQHLAYCRELALARCPELTPADLGGAFRGDSGAWNPADDDGIPTEPDPDESIWIEVSEQLLDWLVALEERLLALEGIVKGDDDDDDDEPGDQRQASGRN